MQAGLESSAFSHGLGATFVDVNHDGRPDLYVANDEDQLYLNVPWPAAPPPTRPGSASASKSRPRNPASPIRSQAWASRPATRTAHLSLFVTNSRGEPSAAYRSVAPGGPVFANARPSFDPALGSSFAGWGTSWVDLANSGRPDLVLTAGAIPVTNLAKDAEGMRVLAPIGGSENYGEVQKILGPGGVRVNGRGLAAADADNDGRMDIAVNTIGGNLVLLRPTGPSGHWLDVALSRFAPGTVVTVTLANGRPLTEQSQAGDSYLSSQDPRLHFGLGAATRAASVTVRWPGGRVTRLANVRGDRIVTVAAPPVAQPRSLASQSYRLAGCTPIARSVSLATVWDRAATAMLRQGNASEPVQARDLFDVSKSMLDAYDETKGADGRSTALSFAAYRLLVWRASYNANLPMTFALLKKTMRGLCFSPGFTSTSGSSPAAVGNRIAASAIAAGKHDGSNESIRYADPTYTPMNAPLVVSQPGTTVHDATFWQPLALAVKPVPGGGSVRRSSRRSSAHSGVT